MKQFEGKIFYVHLGAVPKPFNGHNGRSHIVIFRTHDGDEHYGCLDYDDLTWYTMYGEPVCPMDGCISWYYPPGTF